MIYKILCFFLFPFLLFSSQSVTSSQSHTLSPQTQITFSVFAENKPSKEIEPAFSLAAAATKAVAIGVVDAGYRGQALGVSKDEANEIKDRADSVAKKIFEGAVHLSDHRMDVYASEGFGRDGVEESFKGGEVVNPNGRNETHALIDVIEGTNPFAENNGGLAFHEIDDSVAGGMGVAVTGTAVRSLGKAPDIYADLFITRVPSEKVAAWDELNLDPSPEHIPYLEFRLRRIARENKLTVNDLEVVIMDRSRESGRLEALKYIQETFPGLVITQIEDGTVAHALLATFGRKEGKHKILWTVAAAPESFMNLAVAGAFKSRGAIAGLRLYSSNINDSEKGKATAKSLAWRYNFSEKEKEDLRLLRPEDAEEIIKGEKVFTMRNVQGDVDGAFSFITDSGVFNQRGVLEIASNQRKGHSLRTLRVFSQEDQAYAWIEDEVYWLNILELFELQEDILIKEAPIAVERAL